MKFFPVYEGGLLVSSRRPLDQVQLQSAGLGFEAKVSLNTLDNGFAYQGEHARAARPDVGAR